MRAKSLGQIAYEAAFPLHRTAKAHNDYPPSWDRIARAVLRGVRRRDEWDYEKAMRSLPNKGATGGAGGDVQ